MSHGIFARIQKDRARELRGHFQGQNFSWAKLLKDRVFKFSLRHQADALASSFWLNFPWDELVELLKTQSPWLNFGVLRALLNSWVTSTRIPAGKSQKSCIFQCSASHGADRLGHYFQCDVLWKFLNCALSIPEMHPITKLGITLDSRALKATAAAHMYHALRQHTFREPEDVRGALNQALNGFFVQTKLKFASVCLSVDVWNSADFCSGFWPGSSSFNSSCSARGVPHSP